MFNYQSRVHADKIGSLPILAFLIKLNDNACQRWWPGIHLEFHTVKQRSGHVGNVVYMDEHARIEVPRLGAMLLSRQNSSTQSTWEREYICVAVLDHD